MLTTIRPFIYFLFKKGFTDWNSLRNAPSKNKLGLAIPRPTELGYYDYTDLKPRQQQAQLAHEYSIDGFIFHHYWFYDKDHPGPSLHQPLEKMLLDGEPNVPFCLHWCASKWVSIWNGKVNPDFVFKEPGVLQKQYFPINDDNGEIIKHYNWLKRFFHHDNYIKVDGKPVLMMYQKKPGSFPVLKILNEMAKKDGFPGLYFTVGLTKPHSHLLEIGNVNQYSTKPQSLKATLQKFPFDKVLSYPNPYEWNEIPSQKSLSVPKWCLNHGNQKGEYQREPDIVGITSSFDNTPRRNFDEAKVWSSDEPAKVVDIFRKSIYAALYYESCCFPKENGQRKKRRKNDDDRFIVLNAMNEWAEGMALEPSDVYGRQFLETIRDTKLEILKSGCNL